MMNSAVPLSRSGGVVCRSSPIPASSDVRARAQRVAYGGQAGDPRRRGRLVTFFRLGRRRIAAAAASDLYC